MWSYYGRKSKVIRHYPKPIHDKIIEPFAGTAVYSLYKDNWQKEVILVDKYKVITDLWLWLQQVTPKEILSLPDFQGGEDLRDYNLSENERKFIGFWCGFGSSSPRNIVTTWFYSPKNRGYWKRTKQRTADNLHKIKHWQIVNGDYKDLPNETATWYIDPPYQNGGDRYVHSKINYSFLANWCKSRLGQVIVCEGSNADWLPFELLIESRDNQRKEMKRELVWLNNKGC